MGKTQQLILKLGDSFEILKTYSEGSINAIVTDPPYGIEFMGKSWDSLGVSRSWQLGGGFSKPGIGDRQTEWASFGSTTEHGTANPTCAICGGRLRGKKKCFCEQPHDHWKPLGKPKGKNSDIAVPEKATEPQNLKLQQAHGMQAWHEGWLRECFRVLRPGGVIKAFSATRTCHRLAAAMEAVGFVLDPETSIESWVYASGFPKSLNVSKAIDRELGNPREVSGTGPSVDRIALDFGGSTGKAKNGLKADFVRDDASRTEKANKFIGYGTALKPAFEPFICGRKPK